MFARLASIAICLSLGCAAKPAPAPAAKATSGEAEAAPFVQVASDALVGHRAPSATLELLDGSHVDLAGILGKRPIYLKFWATWCVPCREQMPHLEATFRAHGNDLAMYAIDVGVDDPIENVRAFVATKQLAVPVSIDRDGSVAEQFHLNVTPQHVLIDRAGVVRFVGHAVTPELERAIVAVLAPPVGPAPTPTIGAPAVAVTNGVPPLVLDDGATFDFSTRPRKPLALTFATLFCDSYIVDSRPEIGAACAAHARQVEKVHAARPELAWITVAYPVWTDATSIREYRERLHATVPIGIDRGNVWYHHFGIRDSYTTILLDEAGAEIGRVVGDGAGLPALIARAR